LAGDVSGYASAEAARAALASDGHGGSTLSLGAQRHVDFLNLAPNQIAASNFLIG
jgi:hypothetical protein